MTSTKTPFHVVFIGIAARKFSRLVAHVQATRGYRFSHIVTTRGDVDTLLADGVRPGDIHYLDSNGLESRPGNDDLAFLASLEQPGVPTIHNMILADPYVKRLPYADAIAYAVHLARGFETFYRKLQPSAVIAGHDRMIAALSGGVAKRLDVPWFSINFTVLPMGYVALSPRIIPDAMVQLAPPDHAKLDDLAARVLADFEARRLRAPAWVSAHSPLLVIQRFSTHARAALEHLRAMVTSTSDRYNRYPFTAITRQYFRKRLNMLRFPKRWFITEPPSEPFLLFGLHMQPESAIDVFAPFYANQLDFVEKVARAIPPTHRLLVKLHVSDADNYSRRQLRQLRHLPGVQLVAPTAWSRLFLDQCAAVVAISGTMGLEGALLGKPVVSFGTTNYATFPTVVRVENLNDLPALIRRHLQTPYPGRQAILEAYRDFIGHYICATGPGTKVQLDDWMHPDPSPEELTGFLELFSSLENYLQQTEPTLAG